MTADHALVTHEQINEARIAHLRAERLVLRLGCLMQAEEQGYLWFELTPGKNEGEVIGRVEGKVVLPYFSGCEPIRDIKPGRLALCSSLHVEEKDRVILANNCVLVEDPEKDVREAASLLPKAMEDESEANEQYLALSTMYGQQQGEIRRRERDAALAALGIQQLSVLGHRRAGYDTHTALLLRLDHELSQEETRDFMRVLGIAPICHFHLKRVKDAGSWDRACFPKIKDVEPQDNLYLWFCIFGTSTH